MIPVVTLFHWDLPLKLFDDGLSWTNPELIDHYVNFTRVVIQNFPQVGRWITINEPRILCRFSYGEGILAPGIKESGILDYQCSYVILKAHAAVYRMYKKEFPNYKGKLLPFSQQIFKAKLMFVLDIIQYKKSNCCFLAPMSIVMDCQWYEPETKDPEDVAAAERQQQFEVIYIHIS